MATVAAVVRCALLVLLRGQLASSQVVPPGWSVVLKTNGDDTFQYSSPFWTDTTTVLDESSDPEAPGNAKYPKYNSQPFDAIMACVGTLSNCLAPHAFETPIINAADLFGGNHRREGVEQQDFLHVFGVTGYRECEPQRPGFNTVCADGNHARWGYCVNVPSQDCQTADGNDADGVMGFGIEGQDCCPMGAGWTNYVVSDAANGGNEGRQQAWILIRDSAPGLPDGWSVVLKTDGDSTFQYDADYWTSTTNTLNEETGYYRPGNAKYPAYNTQPFDAIMACIGTFDNCLQPYAFVEPVPNSAALFSGAYRDEGIEPVEFLSTFGVHGHRDCEPQRPGFNTVCAGGNHARWGFCNNIPSQNCQSADDNDADGVIGFGLEGQDCCPMGAGWTNFFANDQQDGGAESRKQAWIMVRHATLSAADEQWETILKSNGDETFAYEATLWSDDQLLNEADPTSNPGNAKYSAYLDLEFDAIKVCVGQITNCIEPHAFAEPVPNAATLFDGPYQRQGVVQDDWDRVFDPSGQNEACGMQRPGFNTVCADGNQARWGYCANVPGQPCQEDDSNDADAVIGVGLVGQDCCPMGAGYTNYFVSDAANAGLESRQQVWIQVRAARPRVPAGWTVVLKTNGDDTFQYNSPYWTDPSTVLNEGTDPSAPGNAKYPKFNTQQLDAAMFCFGTLDNCVEPHAFATPISNAVELFSGAYRDEGIVQEVLLETFNVATGGPIGFQDCEMQRPGFNTFCSNGNHARWGYCNNIPSQDCQIEDSDDSDGVIGIGLEGQDCCPMGAGWTNYFVNSQANSGHEQRVQAWVLIRESSAQFVPEGWSVVLKTNGDPTFAYDSEHWTSSTTVLNSHDDPTAQGNAKYAAYNTQNFDAIKACIGTFDNCLPTHAFAEPIRNAADLFGGPHRREGVIEGPWLDVFGVTGQRDCAPQRPGFNTVCNDGNKARWGFCNNVPGQDCQSADDNDADGVIGFGLTGQDCCPTGAGWTNFFVSNNAGDGHESRQQAWIMVRHAVPKVPAGWTVVLKSNGDDTFQYNSPYWTDTSTVLNEDQDFLEVGNAKYSAYNTQEFDAIMACVGSLTNCIPGYRFDEPIANAAELFGGEHRREGVVYENFLHAFDVEGHRDCEPQRPGFNTVCAGGNHARWGFCNNVPSQDCQANDGDDADGVIGFGLEGQDCCPMGAGYTNYFVSANANSGHELRSPAWILIRETCETHASAEWHTVLKTSGDDVFQYSSPYWSNDELLNEHSDPTAPGNAKYPEYSSIRIDAIQLCIGTADNCLPPHAFLDPVPSAKELFTGPYRREGVQDHELLEVFAATGHNNCEPQRPGFNTQCRDGNQARWGFCNNIPSQGCQIHDADDADGVIGIGLQGQDCCPMGAGWTNFFVSSDANSGHEHSLQAFVKVRAAADCVPPGWTVVLKTNGDGVFQYNSPHWTDSTTVLNPTSHPSQAGNAKYPAYNTVQFDAVMGCVGTLANCLEPHTFASPIENSVALFGGDYRREGIPSPKQFLRTFGAHGQKKCRPQRPGFNTQCRDGNHARWGYCANIPSQDCQEEDGDDADGVIGFGLEGQDCCPMGAGWTNYFVSNEAATELAVSSAQPVQAWILVRDVRASSAFNGGTGAAPAPAPPAGDLPACTDYNEFHQLSLPVTRSCCDTPGSCPEAGIPTSCSIDCAAELNPFTAACADFLNLGVNSGLKSILDRTSASCPAIVPCTSMAEFEAQMMPINTACCSGPSDCSTGSPTQCTAECAGVLLPVMESCRTYLLAPENHAVKTLMDDAASRCGTGGGH